MNIRTTTVENMLATRCKCALKYIWLHMYIKCLCVCVFTHFLFALLPFTMNKDNH